MAQLTGERDTPRREGNATGYPVKAGVLIYLGALVVVALGTGLAEPGRAGAGLKAVGRARRTVDNRAGGNGAERVEVERGTFKFANDGTITGADVEGTAYILDDQTVTDTDGGGARSVAGTIREVAPDGVWVTIN